MEYEINMSDYMTKIFNRNKIDEKIYTLPQIKNV